MNKAISPFSLLLLAGASALSLPLANAQNNNTEDSNLPKISKDMGLLQGEASIEGKPVTSVILNVNKDNNINKERLHNLLALKPGASFSSEVIDKDTKALYDSGLVGNVIVIREVIDNGVKVTYNIESQSLLAGVGFVGNGNFNEKKLREQTKLVVGKTINDKDVRTAINGIKKYYADYDYPNITITPSYQAAARKGYVDLIFTINEGEGEQMIHEIRFPGVYDLDQKKLKNVLASQEKGIFSFLTDSGKIDNMKLDEDEQKLIDHLRNEGYMRADIIALRRVPVSDNRIDLEFVINQGAKFTVRSVYFGPISIYTPEQLAPGLSLLNGDNYSAQKVADDIAMIRKYYGSKGYADAQVRADLKEVGNNQVDIQYIVTEGKPCKVGNINIQGNTRTKDHVIRRELPLKPEDNFSSIELEVAQKRLKNLNYFEPVSVTPAPSTRQGYRDVNIEVAEKRTGSLTFGVGFSTIESVVFFANVTQSNFDIYDWSSFSGGGQRFSIETRLGDETQNASISWTEPWFLEQRLALGVRVFYDRSTYYSDYYTQQDFGTAVSISKSVGTDSSVKAEYSIQEIMIDANYGAPLYFSHQDGSYLKSGINLSYTYDTRDAFVLPRKGGKIEPKVGFNGLGGDVNTYTLGISANKYWNLKWDTIFSINGEINTINAWKNTDDIAGKNNPYSRDVPVFDRLYLGGPLNMRGFKYRNVAPYIDGIYGSGNETMGGKSSAFVQFEYTIPIVEQVRFAIFYDIGVVNEDFCDFDTSNYCSDWGIGIRLNLPFGPIAIDYAFPLESGNAIDEGGQFQFYMDYKF